MSELDHGQFVDECLVDLHTPQEDLLVEELVVVVQQNGRVDHRREAEWADSKLKFGIFSAFCKIHRFSTTDTRKIF